MKKNLLQKCFSLKSIKPIAASHLRNIRDKIKKTQTIIVSYIIQLNNNLDSRLRFCIYFLSFLLLIVIIKISSLTIKSLIVVPNKIKKTIYEREIRILDRNEKILVKNAFSYDFYFKPSEILNPEEELDKAISILPKIKQRREKILDKISEKKHIKNSFVLASFNISEDEKLRLIEQGVIGVAFDEKKARYYIHSNLFSHLIGVCDSKGIGVSGIEKSIYDNIVEPNENNSVILSVDTEVQRILHQELANLIESKKAIGAFGMIADVKNGEIIASASLPDFNPNTREGFEKNMFNKYTSGVYEFGSIFKLINTALALKEGMSLTKVYSIPQEFTIKSKTITDMKHSRDSMTVEEIAMYSSNIGSAKIALDIGVKKQKEFFYALGLGDKMQLEISETAKPLLPKQSQWKEVESVTLSYGHGIAVTQAHMLRAFISLLNDGKFTNLTFLKNKSHEYETLNVTDKDVSKKLKKVMRNVVQFGAGKSVRSNFYNIGGKSGTAIKIDERGQYSRKKNILSFFAAFPIEKPKYAIIISLDEPSWEAAKSRFDVTGSRLGPNVKEIIERLGYFSKIEKISDIEKTAIEAEKTKFIKEDL